MDIRILFLIGVTSVMTATAVPACDDPAIAEVGNATALPQSQADEARKVLGDWETIDCFYAANRYDPVCRG